MVGPRLGGLKAERYYQECITMPMFPALTDEDILRVRDAVAEAVK